MDETDAVAPVVSLSGRTSLMDTRTYIDEPDTNLQALLTWFAIAPLNLHLRDSGFYETNTGGPLRSICQIVQ